MIFESYMANRSSDRTISEVMNVKKRANNDSTLVANLVPKEDIESVLSDSSSTTSSSRPANTYIKSSFLSKMFFIWPGQLLKDGATKSIEEKDLPNILEEDQSGVNRAEFERIWRNEVDRVHKLKSKLPAGSDKLHSLKPSLPRALMLDFLKTSWMIQLGFFVRAVAKIVMAVASGYLIQTFIDKSPDGYFWATAITVSNAVLVFEFHHSNFSTWRKGMKLRIGAVSCIFAKSLRLNSVTNDQSTSIGQTMNLVSNDVERFLLAALYGPSIIWGPLQALAILTVGLYLNGPAFAIGVGMFLFVLIPGQTYLSRRFVSFRSKVSELTDKRVNLVSQIIEGVRVMKMSGWEIEFESRILHARAVESKQIHDANRLRSLKETMRFISIFVVSATVFIIHVFVFDDVLTPKLVFTSLSLISILQGELMHFFLHGVIASSECWVAMSRIQRYLEAPEIRNEIATLQHCEAKKKQNGHNLMTVQDVTCHWNVTKTHSGVSGDNGGSVALHNINLSLQKNELTFIIGAVGSGKSALLYALAGELVPTRGRINRSHSSLAYAAQNPWIMNGTIRSNILMGASYDPKYYYECCEACGLFRDFSQFIHGDKTIVGDKGVQCSGGQKARIALARALYLDADILLLDDPLSAVDTKVGRHIFHSAVHNMAVKRGKCVVLATHQHQYIGRNRCAYISDGEIKTIGSFEECAENSSGQLRLISYEPKKWDDDPCINEVTPSNVTIMEEGNSVRTGQRDTKEDHSIRHKDEEHQEKKFTGDLSRHTFLEYAKSMGSIWLSACLILLFLAAQGLQLFSLYLMGRWSELEKNDQKSGIVLIVLLGFTGLFVFISFLPPIATYTLANRASTRLHDAMLISMTRSKVKFFDMNPSGRIINRFTGDVGSNDELLPSTLFNLIAGVTAVGEGLIVVAMVSPPILLLIPFLVWYFLRVRAIFVHTSRDLKRMEGLARSPVFAQLNESINGIATIRPNGSTEYIERKFEAFHDSHARAFWSFLASTLWFSFRMDFLIFLINCSASFLTIFFNEKDWFDVDPVILGVALSLFVQMGPVFQWTVRLSADAANQMVSVERVLEYSKLESEAALSLVGDCQPSWPCDGRIEIKDLSVRYRNSLPLSLNSVSFSLSSGQRLGVVGRTGSGKSTLVQALFRLLEAETGKIEIGGIDIRSLGLHKLRQNMSVINQNPILFSGCTIKENLDPFGHFSDEEIQGALDDVQMMKVVNKLPFGIHSQVSAGGQNFSLGQRQLLCLARALLQKSKILVLDEPTANVDGRTENLLQKALSKSFRDATIISVAHRLDTIIENDLIMVLGNGKVLEYGSPFRLISQDGHFTSMVDDTGDEMSRELKNRAREAHRKING